MEYLTRSLPALILLLVAAFLYALGTAFLVGTYASLTSVSAGVSLGFLHTANWLLVAGGAAALAAVCEAGWRLVLARAWDNAWELAVGAVGVLLIWIGLLINAASGQIRLGAAVVGAVGIAVWAMVTLSRAARRSLAEEQARAAGTPLPRQAVLWLIAAGGLVLLAAGYGFPPDTASTGTGIAAGMLQAAGFGVLFTVVAVAPSRARFLTRALPPVLVGLITATAAFITYAVVAGLVFGPSGTLTGLRIGYSIAIGIQFLAVVVLGLAAWTRLRELSVRSPAQSPG